MTARGWTQADLARHTGLSKAAVSNALDPVKDLPLVDTLTRLAVALDITGRQREELLRLRDQADPRTRRLDGYLAAAGRVAREHPYAGVLPGIVPPLVSVYFRQQVRPVGDRCEDGPGPTMEAGLPADEILTQGETCVVLAGPGGGKSSLLRTYLAASADRWQTRHADTAVPVLVPAAALAGLPLLEALARATTADLAEFGLLEALPPAFFRDPPHPGASWLVMVDALDEITDPGTRRQVLGALAAVAEGKHGSVFQFIVATRPLPDAELDILGAQVPRYELQPFTSDDLTHVVRGWFTALSLPDPEQATERFTQALDGTQLAGLARIPLMTAMLCQLHAAYQDQPLPASRGALYRDFIDLLHQRQHTTGQAGIRTQTRAALERYGDKALAWADHMLDRLPDLIIHLAAEQYAGNISSPVDILAAHPDAAPPPTLPKAEWRRFLDASLRRSGLFTVRAGEIAFLHQTILEHLAARHATRTPRARAQTVRNLINDRWTRHRPWGHKTWSPPLWQDASYIGFVLDAGYDDRTVVAALERVATHGGYEGSLFIVHQVRLGTCLPALVIRSATSTLTTLACGTATGATLGDDDRTQAAGAVAFLGAPHGLSLLYSIACEPTFHMSCRIEAAEGLVVWGDPRGAGLLDAFARDTTLGSFFCVMAAQSLARRGDSRAADLLNALASDTTSPFEDRLTAARALGFLGDSRAADLLNALASDTTLPRVYRCAAVLQMEVFDDQRAINYRGLFGDPDARHEDPGTLINE